MAARRNDFWTSWGPLGRPRRKKSRRGAKEKKRNGRQAQGREKADKGSLWTSQRENGGDSIRLKGVLPWNTPLKSKEGVRVLSFVVLRRVASCWVVLCCVSVALCFIVLYVGGEIGYCFLMLC